MLSNICTGDNMELTWQTSVGEHKGYIPLQFLKENRYSDEIIMTKRRQSRPDKMVATEVFSYVSLHIN